MLFTWRIMRNRLEELSGDSLFPWKSTLMMNDNHLSKRESYKNFAPFLPDNPNSQNNIHFQMLKSYTSKNFPSRDVHRNLSKTKNHEKNEMRWSICGLEHFWCVDLWLACPCGTFPSIRCLEQLFALGFARDRHALWWCGQLPRTLLGRWIGPASKVFCF